MAVHHRGGHTSFYNSKALEMAGIHKDTPNPPGGTFDRDPNGELNGRVTDRATGALSRTGKRSKTTALQEDLCVAADDHECGYSGHHGDAGWSSGTGY